MDHAEYIQKAKELAEKSKNKDGFLANPEKGSKKDKKGGKVAPPRSFAGNEGRHSAGSRGDR